MALAAALAQAVHDDVLVVAEREDVSLWADDCDEVLVAEGNCGG